MHIFSLYFRAALSAFSLLPQEHPETPPSRGNAQRIWLPNWRQKYSCQQHLPSFLYWQAKMRHSAAEGKVGPSGGPGMFRLGLGVSLCAEWPYTLWSSMVTTETEKKGTNWMGNWGLQYPIFAWGWWTPCQSYKWKMDHCTTIKAKPINHTSWCGKAPMWHYKKSYYKIVQVYAPIKIEICLEKNNWKSTCRSERFFLGNYIKGYLHSIIFDWINEQSLLVRLNFT